MSTSHSNYSRGGWGYAFLKAVTGVSVIDFYYLNFAIELLKLNMHVKKCSLLQTIKIGNLKQ